MLTLKFDKRTARLIGSDAGGYYSANAVVKRRDAVAVSVTIYSDGVAAPLTGGTMTLGLKQQGKHSGAIVATATLTVSASSYVGTLSLNTAEVATLFAGVGLPPTEPSYVMLVAELTHSSGWTAETVPVRCENDYIAGDEPAPGESTSALFLALTAAVDAAEASALAADGSADAAAASALESAGPTVNNTNVNVALAASPSASRTALGLGTLATQSGTFSGNSSGTNTGDQTITLTGDVTGSGTGSFAATVANDAVSNAKLANVATQTFKGRTTAATGDPEDLTVAQAKTMLAISNVDNTSDASKPVSTAQQTALNLKADLASPTFTGNPLAPTPATTDDDTSIATTAFVQDVQQAGYTQPTAIAITAAGNSNVAAVTAQNRYVTQRINVTAFSGTATVTLQSASAIAGDKRRFIVAMPAGVGNLIELRNLTSGGTLLATVPMDGALARTWLGYSTFDGTNWGTVSFSPLSVDEFVLARTAFRGDYLNSDGATSNRAQIYGPFDAVNNPREYVAGAASLTIFIQMFVPSDLWTGATRSTLYGVSATNTGFPEDQNNSLSVVGTTTGLRIRTRAVGSNYRESTPSFTQYAGQWVVLKIVFSATGDPVASVNGAALSLTFVTVGVAPSWLDSALVSTYRLSGGNWPAGPAPIVTPILGTTSAADDAFYLSTGRWPAWVVAGGHATADSKPTTGTYPYWFGTGSVSGATASSFNITAGASGLAVRNPGSYTFVGGSMIQVTVTASGLDSSAVISAQGITTPANAAILNGTTTVQLRIQESGVGHLSFDSITSAAGGSISIVKIITCGALSLPSIQPILVIDDASGIGGNQGRLLGMTAVTDKTNARICANTWLASNQRILEGTLFDSTQFAISGPITQVTTGTPTTTIGSVSAGVQYKASSALAAGANPALPVTYKLATGEIWVSSGTAVNVRTTIPLVKIQ